jgi:hypothetical protein
MLPTQISSFPSIFRPHGMRMMEQTNNNMTAGTRALNGPDTTVSKGTAQLSLATAESSIHLRQEIT